MTPDMSQMDSTQFSSCAFKSTIEAPLKSIMKFILMILMMNIFRKKLEGPKKPHVFSAFLSQNLTVSHTVLHEHIIIYII